MLDLEEVKKEASVKYGRVIEDDDPLLDSMRVNDIVLEQMIRNLESISETHFKRVENALQKSSVTAKETAGRVITDAADYVAEQVNFAVTAAMEEAQANLLRELDPVANRIVKAYRGTMVAASVSAVCAVVTLGAALAII